MNEKTSFGVLDHGYVKLIDTWGSDERIIEAARMSTNKGFQGWGPTVCDACGGMGTTTHDILVGGTEHDTEERDCLKCKTSGTLSGDEKLLRYLYEHKHMTPFEMAGMTIEVQAPLFVFREWHRHRTQSYNEMSARYTPLPDLNYVPTVERIVVPPGANKQAQSTGVAAISVATAQIGIERLKMTYAGLEDEYQSMLSAGWPKELARLVIPVGRYSRMRASANLRNWLGFLTLRMDVAAQHEIREYAACVAGLVKQSFPRTFALFIDGGKR